MTCFKPLAQLAATAALADTTVGNTAQRHQELAQAISLASLCARPSLPAATIDGRMQNVYYGIFCDDRCSHISSRPPKPFFAKCTSKLITGKLCRFGNSTTYVSMDSSVRQCTDVLILPCSTFSLTSWRETCEGL